MTNAKQVWREILNESSGWELKNLSNIAHESICDGGPEKPFVPTPEEFNLLKMIAQGMPVDEIAEKLNFSAITVTICLRALLDKMGARSPANAVAIAFLDGILTKDSFEA